MNEVSYEVDLLEGRISSIPMKEILNSMGFPVNWRDIMEEN